MANKREMVVGGFVLVGLAVTGAVIFTIGNERRAFASKVVYQASFPDVQGLKPGAPVRLSGIDIGVVKSVAHGPNLADDRLYVKMEVVRDEASRIREDSVAKVANKGLLGDKMMEITPGTAGKPGLPSGATLRSEDPADYTNLLVQVGEITTKTNSVLANLEKTTQMMADDAVRKDIESTLRSVTVVMNNVATGQGYVGKLLNDPGEAERISHTLAQFDRTAVKMNQTLDNVNMLTERVTKGPGFAHSIIYDSDANKSVTQIGDAAGEVAIALKQVREGNGLARSMLYGGPGQEKLGENLTAASADMRAIMADMRKGKGTLGALLVDPSVYEDMKAVLGNVQRNDVLRALVRYSIKQDEKKPAVQVEGAAASESK
jgi:phospholipid/cholesterol/gamma-HCH transport system substrate-binding protein